MLPSGHFCRIVEFVDFGSPIDYNKTISLHGGNYEFETQLHSLLPKAGLPKMALGCLSSGPAHPGLSGALSPGNRQCAANVVSAPPPFAQAASEKIIIAANRTLTSFFIVRTPCFIF